MDDIFLSEDDLNDPYEVTTPSGAKWHLRTQEEKDNYERIAAKYLSDNKFTNIADLQELDRILVAELMCARYSGWILREKDYDGEYPDMIGLQKQIDMFSKEIRGMKRDLGIDKNTRDKEHGEDIAGYIDNLRLRAKEFGVHRNTQAVKAITLLKEVQSKVQLYRNYDEIERSEFHWHAEDVISWLEEKFDEFDELDELFREEQKLWVRDL